MQCFPRGNTDTQILLPSRKQNRGFELASLQMFFQVYLKTTESKRGEKYTAGNRKCCGNHLGKFLCFKIVYFVLFLSHNNIHEKIS